MNSKGFKGFQNMAGNVGGSNPIPKLFGMLLIGGGLLFASSSIYYGNTNLINS
jgi:hypothetical protein